MRRYVRNRQSGRRLEPQMDQILLTLRCCDLSVNRRQAAPLFPAMVCFPRTPPCPARSPARGRAQRPEKALAERTRSSKKSSIDDTMNLEPRASPRPEGEAPRRA